MAFRKVGPAAAVTASTPFILGTISLGAAFGIVRGFQARNWASSAKAGAGTDVLETVELKDANGVIFFLDAADRDYATAAKQIFFDQDDTATGLGTLATDATGAARAAGEGAVAAVVQSPITVTIRNAGTATDYFEIFLYVEV